jgi:hypothetical protein
MNRIKIVAAAAALAIPGVSFATADCCAGKECCKERADCCKDGKGDCCRDKKSGGEHAGHDMSGKPGK